MGATTSKGYPYPIGTDRVSDGDNAIQALAEAADDKAGVFAGGTVSVTANNAIYGDAAVTFPVGRFSVAPIVMSSLNTGTSAWCVGAVYNATASGCTVRMLNNTGNSNTTTMQVSWLARAV